MKRHLLFRILFLAVVLVALLFSGHISRRERSKKIQQGRDNVAVIENIVKVMRDNGTFEYNVQIGETAYTANKNQSKDDSKLIRLLSFGASSAAGNNLADTLEKRHGVVRSVNSDVFSDNQIQVFYALYSSNPELAEQYIEYEAIKLEYQKNSSLREWAGKNWLTRSLSLIGGAGLYLFSGIDTFGPAGTHLAATGEALFVGSGFLSDIAP